LLFAGNVFCGRIVAITPEDFIKISQGDSGMLTAVRFDFDPIYEAHPNYFGFEPSQWLHEFISTTVNEGKKALDLGCGQGRDTITLACAGYDVTAVDISPRGVRDLTEVADEQELSITCRCQDVTGFAYPQSEYQLAIASTLLDHLLPSDIEGAAHGMLRSLVPGGFGYAVVHTVGDPGYKAQVEHDESFAAIMSETAGAIQHYFAHNELPRLFSGLGAAICACSEDSFWDESHGPRHQHHFATILFQKP